jgi:hypothetical protein
VFVIIIIIIIIMYCIAVPPGGKSAELDPNPNYYYNNVCRISCKAEEHMKHIVA